MGFGFGSNEDVGWGPRLTRAGLIGFVSLLVTIPVTAVVGALFGGLALLGVVSSPVFNVALTGSIVFVPAFALFLGLCDLILL